MHKRRPFLSIIVPTHRRAHILSRALKSIIEQDVCFLFEIIVVSDCIDADSSAVCEQLLRDQDIYIRRNGIKGPAQSRNIALSLSKGDIIIFLDDDDAFHRGAFMEIFNSTNLMNGNPIYFNCSVVLERRLPDSLEFLTETKLDFQGMLTDEVYVKNRIPNSCIAFPAHCLNGIYFDEHLRAYEDWDFLLSVIEQRQIIHEPILGVQIYKNADESTENRGSSLVAQDFNAVLDYINIYRRHPAPNNDLKVARSQLLTFVGYPISAEML